LPLRAGAAIAAAARAAARASSVAVTQAACSARSGRGTLTGASARWMARRR
jgi:hypothetical protein